MSQQVQTIRFKKAKGWTSAKAEAWLRDHDFSAPSPDETTNWLWYRQFDPALCAGEHKTLTTNMPDGVQMVTCERAGKSLEPPTGTVHVKALQDPEDALRYIVTDESVDRIGDVVEVKGWSFRAFEQNPIALWQHDHETPIGTWHDLKSEGGRVSARLQLAAPGTSPFIDSVRSLVKQRIVRAASVGFLPKAIEPLDPDNPRKGLRFKEAELLEISLVSVPANPRAVQMSKSLPLRDARRLLVKSDLPEAAADSTTGKSAVTIPPSETRAMSTALTPAGLRPTQSQKIQFKQAEIAELQDELRDLLDEYDESRPEQGERVDDLNQRISESQRTLERLQTAERSLGEAAVEPKGKVDIYRPGEMHPELRRRGGIGHSDLAIKAMTAVMKAHGQRLPLDEIVDNFYRGDDDIRLVAKAGVSPALTTVAGWAQELVQQSYGQFLELFVGNSVFPAISAERASFDGTGKIVYPVEGTASPALAGSFVGEAMPIPVRKGALTSLTLNPYKMGVITTWSREIANQSTPTIEGLLRGMVVRQTRKAIDTALLDNNAAVTGVRPAGLQTYATGSNTAPSAGNSTANMLTDIRGRIDRITSLDMGERLQWIMHPSRKLGLEYATNATTGGFQFPSVQSNGTLAGYPIITSTNVPSAIVFLVDAASIVFAIAPAPELMTDDTATLHMEDTSPSQIIPGPALPPGTAAPGTIGAIPTPVMSLFQTATFALRLLWDMSWGVARTGAVQTITGCAW